MAKQRTPARAWTLTATLLMLVPAFPGDALGSEEFAAPPVLEMGEIPELLPLFNVVRERLGVSPLLPDVEGPADFSDALEAYALRIGAPLTPDDRESIASIEAALTLPQQAAFAGLFNALAYREKVASQVFSALGDAPELTRENQIQLLVAQMLASVSTEVLIRSLAVEPPRSLPLSGSTTASSSSGGSAALNSCGWILLDLNANDDVRSCDYSFQFDYGGDDVYYGNAGGAAGGAPVCNNCDVRWPRAAFAIDVFGDDVYETPTFITRLEAEGRVRDAGACSYGETVRAVLDGNASGSTRLKFPGDACWAEWTVSLEGGSIAFFAASHSDDGWCASWELHVDGSALGSSPPDCGTPGPIERLEIGQGVMIGPGIHTVRLTERTSSYWVDASLDYIEIELPGIVGGPPPRAHAGGGSRAVAGLIDVRGNDRYTSRLPYSGAAATGSGSGGTGFLLDLAGDDRYDASVLEGAANGAGLGGFLADVSGNDLYRARGQPDRYSSLNGASWGGILDIAGNDLYLDLTRTACIPAGSVCGSSNGASYGFIIDLAGNDWYDANCRRGAWRNGDYGLIYDAEGRDVYLDGRNGTQEVGCEAGVVDESVSPKPPRGTPPWNALDFGRQVDRTPTKNLATENKWLVSPPYRVDQGVGQACVGPTTAFSVSVDACTQDPFALTQEGLQCLADYTTDIRDDLWFPFACEPFPQALMTDGDEHSPSADAGQLYWLDEGKLFTLNPFTRVIEPLLLALNVTAFQASGTSVVWRSENNRVFLEDTARNVRTLLGNATGELDFDGRHAVWDDNGCVRAFDVVLGRDYGCVGSGGEPRVSGDHVAFLNKDPWNSEGVPVVRSLTLGITRSLDVCCAYDIAIDGNLVAWTVPWTHPVASDHTVYARDLADVWNRVFVLGEGPFLGGGIDVSGGFVVWTKKLSDRDLTNNRIAVVGRDVSHVRYTDPVPGSLLQAADDGIRMATDRGCLHVYVQPCGNSLLFSATHNMLIPLAGAEVVISQGLLAGSDAVHPRVSGNLVTWEECQLARSGGYSPDSPLRCATERDVYYAHLLGPEMVGVSLAGGIENCYNSASPEGAPSQALQWELGKPDLDEDGMGDCWVKYYAQVAQQVIDTVSDLDCDTLSNLGEFQWQTHPLYDQPPCFTLQGYPGVVLFNNGRDFDLDGLLDGYEARYIERANAYSSATTYGSAGGASVAVQNRSYEARARNPAWSEYGSMVPQLCELPTRPGYEPCGSNSQWCSYHIIWDGVPACEFVVTGETQTGGDLWYWPGPGALGVRPPEDWYWEDWGLQYPGHPLSLASSGSSPVRYHLPGVALHHPLKDHDADGDGVRDMEDKNSDDNRMNGARAYDAFTDGEEIWIYDTFPDYGDSDCGADATQCHGSRQVTLPGSDYTMSADRGTGDGLSDSREAYYARNDSGLESILFDEVPSANPLVSVRVDAISNVLLDPDSDGDGILDGEECLQSRNGQLGHGPAAKACNPNFEPFVNTHPPNLPTAPCPSAYNADSDYDELGDGAETDWAANACLPDTDGDLMPDSYEVVKGFNPASAADGGLDPDQDGLLNWEEHCYPMPREQCEQRTRDTKDKRMGVYWFGTDPLNPDSDNDALCDGGGGAANCLALQPNGKGERDYGTNATDPDHDNDGLPDGYEAKHALKILTPDANEDADDDSYSSALGSLFWSNLREYCWNGARRDTCEQATEAWVLANGVYWDGTSASNPNTDGDCGKDGWEVFVGYDPKFYTPDTQDDDNDGLGFCAEAQAGTFPSVADSDIDGLCDGGRALNCKQEGAGQLQPGEADYATIPTTYDTDADQWRDGSEAKHWDPLATGVVPDTDSDGFDNLHDNDSDNDGILDGAEFFGPNPTNPGSADEDGDNLSDPLEQNGWDITVNGALIRVTSDPKVKDTDADGLHDGEEFEKGSNPRVADTDGDGMPDEWEVKYGLAPGSSADAAADPDNDALSNSWEHTVGATPTDWDSDDDGMPDGWEFEYGLNATDASDGTDDAGTTADRDGDMLANRAEYAYGMPQGWSVPAQGVYRGGTNPLRADTDSDGAFDGEEVGLYASDPRLRDTDGDTMLDGNDPRPVVEDANPQVTNITTPTGDFLESVRFDATDNVGLESVRVMAYYGTSETPVIFTPTYVGGATYEHYFEPSLGPPKAYNLSAVDANGNRLDARFELSNGGDTGPAQANTGPTTMAFPAVFLLFMLLGSTGPRIAMSVAGSAAKAAPFGARITVATEPVVINGQTVLVLGTLAANQYLGPWMIQQVRFDGSVEGGELRPGKPEDKLESYAVTGALSEVILQRGDASFGLTRIQSRAPGYGLAEIGDIIRRGSQVFLLESGERPRYGILFHGSLRGEDCWIRLEILGNALLPGFGQVWDLHRWCRAPNAPKGPSGKSVTMIDLLEAEESVTSILAAGQMIRPLMSRARMDDSCIQTFQVHLVDAKKGPDRVRILDLQLPCQVRELGSVLARSSIDHAILQATVPVPTFELVRQAYHPLSSASFAEWYWGPAFANGTRRASAFVPEEWRLGNFTAAGWAGNGYAILNWTNGKRDLLASYGDVFVPSCTSPTYRVPGGNGVRCYEYALGWAERLINMSGNESTLNFSSYVPTAVLLTATGPSIYFELAERRSEFQFERKIQ